MTEISIVDARRLALRAQGFCQPRPLPGTVGHEHIRRVFDRVKLVQIDSVNALIRTQYLPFWSRLGSYPVDLLHDYAYTQRNTFEYWAHEACIVPVEHYPIFGYRCQKWVAERRWTDFLAEHPNFENDIISEVSARGPLSVSDLDMRGPRIGYWSASPGKMALYHLHRSGRLMISDRLKPSPTYDLTERIVPADHLNAPEMSLEAALRNMALMAVDAMGVASVADIADYYRVRRTEMAPFVSPLVDENKLVSLEVGGSREAYYALPSWEVGAASVSARALLSPFDSLVWCRRRIETLFDFHYRIEIYVPAKKRKWGYYVLPFLLDERLSARVDLKCDRQAKVLRVPAAYLEDGCDPDHVARELALELQEMAAWLGMERVVVGRRGDFVSPLKSAVKEAARAR